MKLGTNISSLILVGEKGNRGIIILNKNLIPAKFKTDSKAWLILWMSAIINEIRKTIQILTRSLPWRWSEDDGDEEEDGDEHEEVTYVKMWW